jgi:hypothetical protein
VYAHNAYAGRLIGGIASRYYYISSEVNYKSSLIVQGIDGWNFSYSRTGVSSKVSFNKTTNKSSSVMDIYGAWLGSGIGGQTTYWSSAGSKISPTSTNWKYCKVTFNVDGVLSNYEWTRTSAHEMGHVFGFSENNSEPNSIMCQSAYCSGLYNLPIAVDIRTLNNMY